MPVIKPASPLSTESANETPEDPAVPDRLKGVRPIPQPRRQRWSSLYQRLGGVLSFAPRIEALHHRPSLDLRLPFRLGIEVDALYRAVGYSSESGSRVTFGYAYHRERSNSWEFPVLGKYRVPLPLNPFVGVGFNSRWVKGTEAVSGGYSTSLSILPYTFFSAINKTAHPLTHGLVVSTGFELGIKHLRISPEFRYQRWTQRFLEQYGSSGSYELFSNQNEAFLLIGLSWRK